MQIADEPIAPIPPEIRRIQDESDADCREQRPEMAAFSTEREDITYRRENPIRHSIFCKQTEPAGDPDRTPPGPPAIYQCSNDCVERCRPERERRRIG